MAQAEADPNDDAPARFDMLAALFTNLGAVSVAHRGVVHDDSEPSDRSAGSEADEPHPVPAGCPATCEQGRSLPESPGFSIDLDRFASSAGVAESVARHSRYRAAMVRWVGSVAALAPRGAAQRPRRQALALSTVLVEHWAGLHDGRDRPTFHLGVIGAGLVGRAIIRSALEAGACSGGPVRRSPHDSRGPGLRREQILASTRRPETIDGVAPACFDNGRVFGQCDLVLVCVLPHQVHAVAADYRACTAPQSIVAVLSSTIAPAKLQAMFGGDAVVGLTAVLARGAAGERRSVTGSRAQVDGGPDAEATSYYRDLAARVQRQVIVRFGARSGPGPGLDHVVIEYGREGQFPASVAVADLGCRCVGAALTFTIAC